MFLVLRLEAFQDRLKTVSSGHASRNVQTEVTTDSGVFLLKVFFAPSVRVEEHPAWVVVARVFSIGVEENGRGGTASTEKQYPVRTRETFGIRVFDDKISVRGFLD